MRGSRASRLFVLSLCFLFFVGCSGKRTGKPDGPPRHIPRNLDRVPDAVPRVEPLSRYGNRFKNSNTYVALNKRYRVMPTSRGYCAEGRASWYGTKFHGRRTSSGEPYNMFAMTAAHRSLPLPTFAKVTNLENGRSVVVKINDRGPFHNNRLIDLSYVAAHKLGILGRGTGHVRVESVDPRDHGGRIPRGKLRFSRIASAPASLPVKSSGIRQNAPANMAKPGQGIRPPTRVANPPQMIRPAAKITKPPEVARPASKVSQPSQVIHPLPKMTKPPEGRRSTPKAAEKPSTGKLNNKKPNVKRLN